jgi:streptogramin lyase
VPKAGSGPRRLAMDSKGKVYFSEYFGGNIGTIDPDTGKLTEFKLPLKYTSPYGIEADAQDNIWSGDDFYESLIKLDPKTSKVTYFPLPTLALVDVPKIRRSRDETLWFYPRAGAFSEVAEGRGRGSKIVEAFQPTGNTPQACYPWMSCSTSLMQARQ